MLDWELRSDCVTFVRSRCRSPDEAGISMVSAGAEINKNGLFRLRPARGGSGGDAAQEMKRRFRRHEAAIGHEASSARAGSAACAAWGITGKSRSWPLTSAAIARGHAAPPDMHRPVVAHDSQGTSCASHVRQHAHAAIYARFSTVCTTSDRSDNRRCLQWRCATGRCGQRPLRALKIGHYGRVREGTGLGPVPGVVITDYSAMSR